MYRALIVEDNEDLAETTRARLTHAGYEADAAHTCAQALERLEQKEYDLILLDVVLPDRSGNQLCADIRASCGCPIIFMSCIDDTDTIIRSLKSGGDDYMVKPINYDELLARADAIIRRGTFKKAPRRDLAVYRHFSVDTAHHRVLRPDGETDLSSIEYAIFQYMVRHPDTLLLYSDIYQNVWDSDSLGDVRTVMVHISNLRKKIDPDRIGIITTVRGAGYIFSDV